MNAQTTKQTTTETTTQPTAPVTLRTISAGELRAARKAGISGLKKACRKAKQSLIQGTFGTYGLSIASDGKVSLVLPYMAVTITRDKVTGKVSSTTLECEYAQPLEIVQRAETIRAELAAK